MSFLAVLPIALRRLWNNKILVFCSIAGLTATVAIASSIPMYADAANFRVLMERLAVNKGEFASARPPFAFMYSYVGSSHGNVEIEDWLPADSYVSDWLPRSLGLSTEQYVRHVKTNTFTLFPATEDAYASKRQPLGWVKPAFVSDLQEHIVLTEGRFFQDEQPGEEAIEALVSQEFAAEVGLHIGETFIALEQLDLQTAQQGGADVKRAQALVRIVGIWKAQDEADEYWFYSPEALKDLLLIDEESFRDRLAPIMREEVDVAIWYYVFSGDTIHADSIPGLTQRIARISAQINSLLPNTSLVLSPMDALADFRWTTFLTTIILTIFSIPILILVLYFVSMISGLIVQRQQGEISVLKSRGTGDMQVLGIYVIEGLIATTIGTILGLLLARQLAVLVGDTISFLTLGHRQQLSVAITPTAIRMAILAGVVALLASLLPAWRATRLTIVSYRNQRSRDMQQPLWQRYFLDILLLIPAFYGYYLLRSRGSLSFLGTQPGGDPFENPLLFVAPSLTILAIGLFFIRVFPLLMRGVAWAARHVFRSVSLVLALGQLARVPKQYTSALLLLVMTLSLSTLFSSMARTLDQGLVDSTLYRYGADYYLTETGVVVPTGNTSELASSLQGSTSGAQTGTPAGTWIFVPVEEHLKVPGITAATRVGTYPVAVVTGSSAGQATLYGIDRLDFAQVAFFRRDFAPNSLGELMNRLATDRAAVLVNRRFLTDYQLSVGDRVGLSFAAFGERKTLEFVIADAVTYFPTFYPADDRRYLFVANLDYIFDQLGTMIPYDVWIRTVPGVHPGQIKQELSQRDIQVLNVQGSQQVIDSQRARPERAGMFGILSVGFVAAALLTVLGFLLHSFISFRRRFIEFGVLRAIGLSLGQMVSLLACEQLLLILSGVSAGTLLGIWVSRLYVPFLQVSANQQGQIPPFIVHIAWDDIVMVYIAFAAMLVFIVAGMIWLLARLRSFEAIKLGEAV